MTIQQTTKKWTSERLKQLEKSYPNSTWDELLEEFSFSTLRSIQSTANRLGVKKNNRLSNAYIIHDKQLFDKWTEKSAYILGYLEADGYITANKKLSNNTSIRVTFACSIKDIEYLKQLQQICKHNGKITVRTHRLNNNKEYNSWTFEVFVRVNGGNSCLAI